MCVCVRCSACFLSPCNILICKRNVLFLFWTTTTTTIRLALYAPAELGLARCSLALSLPLPLLTAVLSFNDLTVFGIRCAVLNLRYQIALLAKNTQTKGEKKTNNKKAVKSFFLFCILSV